jgi:hypothetical protein
MHEAMNIYCDESRHTSDPSDRYMVIGAIGCERDQKRDIVRHIDTMRFRFDAQGEFGWKRLSPNKRDFYFELIEFFAANPSLAFRCIVVDRKSFVSDDEELGFYKIYYQMLHRWLSPNHEYYIYLDHKVNADKGRLPVLRQCLQKAHTIRALESADSKELGIMQLTDLFIGAVGYAWNERSESEIKVEFCAKLAASVKLPTLVFSTWPSVRKFNIFAFGGAHE